MIMEQQEVSMVDEILSTPEGRAMMKCVQERDELRNLLDKANELITYARDIADESCGGDEEWMSGFRQFRAGYEKDVEKR
jgi:hypothetical protein